MGIQRWFPDRLENGLEMLQEALIPFESNCVRGASKIPKRLQEGILIPLDVEADFALDIEIEAFV